MLTVVSNIAVQYILFEFGTPVTFIVLRYLYTTYIHAF